MCVTDIYWVGIICQFVGITKHDYNSSGTKQYLNMPQGAIKTLTTNNNCFVGIKTLFQAMNAESNRNGKWLVVGIKRNINRIFIRNWSCMFVVGYSVLQMLCQEANLLFLINFEGPDIWNYGHCVNMLTK